MSKMKEYRLKYGKGEQSITLDENKVLQIIDAEPGAKITDLKQAVLDAVRNPVGSAPLREVVKAGDKVVILVSDITRVWTKTSQYLPIVVEELNNNGVPDEDISVIVAAGTHRANTDEEKKIILGEDLFRRLKVYDHDAYDMDKNVYLGTTRRGTPVYLDKRAVEADKVILTVADTGIGIPDEDKDRVFERFYRVDKSRSRNSGGTGLGLSIVRHAVMFHNGTITLNSKMGEGTTITVSFPAIG